MDFPPRHDESRMNVDNKQQLSGGSKRSAAETQPTAASPVQSLARRRAIFKGLGKGGAVLAATVPIQTLAGQTLLTADGGHQCSVSGMHSGVHSAATDVIYCGGYTPTYWGAVSTVPGRTGPANSWPSPLPNGSTPYTKCRDVFTGAPVAPNTTLFDVMKGTPTADIAHWICAWLNGLKQKSTHHFPYSGQKVMDFYNANNLDALTFFKTYTENYTA